MFFRKKIDYTTLTKRGTSLYEQRKKEVKNILRKAIIWGYGEILLLLNIFRIDM